MPSEYHPMHCPCRECRVPANRSRFSDALLFAVVLGLLSSFSVLVVHGVALVTGGAQ